MMYNFSIYDPTTGNYINRDLSKNVNDEVKIPEIIQTKVIEPAKKELANKKQKRQDKIKAGKFDEKMINEALKLHKQQFSNTKFVTSLNLLKNKGLDDCSAWDYKNLENFNVVKEKPKEEIKKITEKTTSPKQKERYGVFTIDLDDDDDNSPEYRLTKIREKIAEKIGLKEVVLPRSIKRFERKISKSLFKSRN